MKAKNFLCVICYFVNIFFLNLDSSQWWMYYALDRLAQLLTDIVPMYRVCWVEWLM